MKIALYTLMQAVSIIKATGVWGPDHHINEDSKRTKLNGCFRDLYKAGKPLEVVLGKAGVKVTIRRHGKQHFHYTTHEGKPSKTRLVHAHSIVINEVAYDAPAKDAHGYVAPIYIDATGEEAAMYMAGPSTKPQPKPSVHPASPQPQQPQQHHTDMLKPHTNLAPEEEEARVANALLELILNVRDTERQARELEPPSITASLSDADAAWAAYREDHRALSELANEQLLALGRLVYNNEALVIVRSPHRPKDMP